VIPLNYKIAKILLYLSKTQNGTIYKMAKLHPLKVTIMKRRFHAGYIKYLFPGIHKNINLIAAKYSLLANSQKIFLIRSQCGKRNLSYHWEK
jgi:hypothetical protein